MHWVQLKSLARAVRNSVYRIAYRGSKRWCPVCEKHARRFRPFGVEWKREQAMCVHCGALERHRLVRLFLERKTDILTTPGKRFLHIAPEPCEAYIRRRVGSGYVSADLLDPTVDVRMDVTRIDYPDDSFDVIYCSHVLEHVSDDRLALREFRRVLAPTGCALFLVPMTAPETFEDATIIDPRDRLLAFGQDDHVRRYGPDFVERLQEAGFEVQVVRDTDVADSREIDVMGLGGAGEIFLGV
jgi:hypothetical protein